MKYSLDFVEKCYILVRCSKTWLTLSLFGYRILWLLDIKEGVISDPVLLKSICYFVHLVVICKSSDQNYCLTSTKTSQAELFRHLVLLNLHILVLIQNHQDRGNPAVNRSTIVIEWQTENTRVILLLCHLLADYQ